MKYLLLYLSLTFCFSSCENRAANRQDEGLQSANSQDYSVIQEKQYCDSSFTITIFDSDEENNESYSKIYKLGVLNIQQKDIDTLSSFIVSRLNDTLDTIYMPIFEGLGMSSYLAHNGEDSILMLYTSYEYVDAIHLLQLKKGKFFPIDKLILEIDFEKLEAMGEDREYILPMTEFKICKIGEKEIQCQHPDLAVSKKIQLRE